MNSVSKPELPLEEGTRNVLDPEADGNIPASWRSDSSGAHDQTLVENWLLKLRSERFRSRKSGKTHDFFVAYLPDAVHVIAVTPASDVVMVRQFRAGLRRDGLETPGGLVEPGEDPCIAGARELLEETGYRGTNPILLGTLAPAPGLLAQRVSTVVIHDATRIAEPAPDQTEELTIELVPLTAIRDLIIHGKIEHGIVVAGLLWWLAGRIGPGPSESAASCRPLDQLGQSPACAVPFVGPLLSAPPVTSHACKASTANAVPAFVMKCSPSRLSDRVNQRPDSRWLASSHKAPRRTAGSSAGTPACRRTNIESPVAYPSLAAAGSLAVPSCRFHAPSDGRFQPPSAR